MAALTVAPSLGLSETFSNLRKQGKVSTSLFFLVSLFLTWVCFCYSVGSDCCFFYENGGVACNWLEKRGTHLDVRNELSRSMAYSFEFMVVGN